MRQKETVTFADPVVLNGIRGNMAVVVNMNGNRYLVHRIVLLDGSTFKFSDKNKETKQESYRGGTKNSSLANTTSLASKHSIPNSSETVNKKFSLPENPTPEQIGQALYDHEISMEEYRELIAKANERAVQASGAIDQGEMVAPPNKPNPTPVSVKLGTKVSEHVRTIFESGYASPDMEAYLKEKVLEGLGSFVPTN